jgi:hypothetical protein
MFKEEVMLSDELKHLRNEIELKSSTSRSSVDEEVLNSLLQLNDLVDKVKKMELEIDKENIYTTIITGPAGKCPCCGK